MPPIDDLFRRAGRKKMEKSRRKGWRRIPAPPLPRGSKRGPRERTRRPAGRRGRWRGRWRNDVTSRRSCDRNRREGFGQEWGGPHLYRRMCRFSSERRGDEQRLADSVHEQGAREVRGSEPQTEDMSVPVRFLPTSRVTTNLTLPFFFVCGLKIRMRKE